MRLTTVIIVLLFCVVGCGPSVDQIRTQNRQNLLKLSVGMSKQEVLDLMGTQQARRPVASAVLRGATGDMRPNPPTITNPYRSEILRSQDKTFEVLYYYTDIKNNDGTIMDDELTPLVFDEGKLIGWGRNFLQENVQKYEIRLR